LDVVVSTCHPSCQGGVIGKIVVQDSSDKIAKPYSKSENVWGCGSSGIVSMRPLVQTLVLSKQNKKVDIPIKKSQKV
jgi:hypothetical protein